jgi:hypothetical protein
MSLLWSKHVVKRKLINYGYVDGGIYVFTLKMEAVASFDMLVNIYHISRRHIPNESNSEQKDVFF